MAMGFTESTNLSIIDSASPRQRGKAVSVKDMYGLKAYNTAVGDARVHDANFAFLTTTLAKLHQDIKEPIYYTTWAKDVPADLGGGFVDYVEYYTVDWAGIMNQQRNVVSNNTNFIPRVNAGLNQKRVRVYTYSVAYDIRFIELEKMSKINMQKSLEEIYKNIITAGWDLFVQNIAYNGDGVKGGLFNSDNVATFAVPTLNGAQGFEGLTDAQVVAIFNGIFEYYLKNSNMNIRVLPDTILVPTFVSSDLNNRISTLYTNTLAEFLKQFNLGKFESDGELKITINGRADLNTLGDAQAGRIVVYKKDKNFVRLDIPYPMQHYITLPNIERMSYTTAFVGQVSEVQLPYNTSDTDLGPVSYWDLTPANA